MYVCRDCGEHFEDRGDVYYLADTDDYVCTECWDNDSYNYCDSCGDRFSPNYYMNYDDNDGYYYCDSCWNNRESDNEIVRGYHDRDLPINYLYLDSELKEGITKDDLLYFGTEQECYNKSNNITANEMAYKIREKYPELEFVFERDSSIGGDSFEMISQPMTMAFIKANKDKLKDINQMIIDNGFTSHNSRTCGLHIHFSRSYFKDDEDKYIQKLTLFFEQYKDELKKFSRRNDFGWCQWISDTCGYDKRYLKSSVVLKDYAKDNPSHGIAINLGNRDTIEIRIFRGTLKFETYMASLELVDSLVRTIKTKETRKINFDNVVNMNGNEYIKTYCEEKAIYNSRYMSDETKSVMKELASKKQRIENVKTQCKEEMTKTLNEMLDLTKTTNVSLEEDDVRITFNILSSINNILSSRVRDLKSDVFNTDTETIENSYKKYISNYTSYNPVNYYQALIDDIGYIVNSSSTNPLMCKVIDLYSKAKETLNKLNLIVNTQTNNGEE